MSTHTIRKRLFGYRKKDVDRRLQRLEQQIVFQRMYLERTIADDRAAISALLAEEEMLWQAIVESIHRLDNPRSSAAMPEAAEHETESIMDSGSAAAARPPGRLGDLLIEQEVITGQQLAVAMEYQTEHGGRLGDILVELNMVSFDQLAIAVQQLPRKARLGDLLLQQGIITREQLDQALAFQRNSGGMLGDILTSLQIVEPEQMYRALATQSGIGRVGANKLQAGMPKLPEALARAFNAVVISKRTSNYLVAVGAPLKPDEMEHLQQILDFPIEQVMATREEMELFWKAVYQEELLDHSTRGLLMEQPDNSAHVTFTRWQLWAGLAALATVLVFLGINWLVTLIVVNCIVQIFYFIMSVFKFAIIIKGTSRHAQMRFTEEQIQAIDERELPDYTILVPMYKEANIIPHLLRNLERLDYPKAKLDVRLLLEEDDVESIQVLRSMHLPPYYTTIVVPHSLPKTKPKACNYGLIRARGQYVVIYDAEDRPDPDQLKKVHAAFKQLPDHFACIQSKLNYFNSEQNLLTRWFTQEYSMWFELLLPGVMQLDVPIPLGGTSNHFKMDVLKKLNAWDPYNVTEDADLGVRLYKAGYKTAIVDSRTWEEANSRVGNWIRQRSRWIKGYMQTWLVHMRNPLKLWREVGFKGFWGFQVMILATPMLPLLNPLFWIMLLVWYATELALIPQLFPGAIYYLSAVIFFFGNFIFVYSNAAGMFWVIHDLRSKGNDTFSYGLVKYALLTPLYWILMSIAAIKAAWQLITKPFYWEKTDHGLTTHPEEIGSTKSTAT